jgi:peptide/nickel transport system substrate-binding protein
LKADSVDVVVLRDASLIARARSEGIDGPSVLQNMGGQVLMNNGVRGAKTPTADVRVRRAVAAAIDPNVIDERNFDGKGQPTSAIFAKGSRYFQGLDGPSYNLEQAKALVAQLRSEGAWDGKLRLVCANTQADLSVTIKTMLELAGISVELDNASSQAAQISKVLTDANFDLACWGNNLYDDGDPWSVLDYQFRSTSKSNYRGYANPAFDAALDDLKKAATAEQTKAALARIQQVWNDSIPSMNYQAVEVMVASGDRVHGLTQSQEAIVLFDKAFVDR